MAAKDNNREVRNKNIINIGGKPLMQYSLESASQSKYIDDVYLTTNSESISNIGKGFGAIIIDRPDSLASHSTSLLEVYQHAIEHIENTYKVNSDLILLLQGNSPILDYRMIDEGFGFMEYHNNFDSYVTVSEYNKFHPSRAFRINNNSLIPIINNNESSSNRDMNGIYFCDGGMFIIRRNNLKNPNMNIVYPWLGTNIKPTIRKYYVDLDNELDIKILEYLINKDLCHLTQ